MNLTPEQVEQGRRNFLKVLAGTPALAALGVSAALKGPVPGGPVRVGFVGVGSILAIEAAYSPPYWVHALIAIPLLVILPLILLRPVKAILVCQQYLIKAQEGRVDSG